MMDKHGQVFAKIKQVTSEAKLLQYSIYLAALALKGKKYIMLIVLNKSANVVNFNKSIRNFFPKQTWTVHTTNYTLFL